MTRSKLAKLWIFLWLALLPLASATAQDPKPLRNADVVKLVKAQLQESTIILTIQASKTAFDTSPSELIRLKNEGVGPKIIEVMIQSGARPAAAAPAPAAPPQASAPAAPTRVGLWGSKQTRVDADRVFLLDSDKRVEMKFTRPSTRSRFIYSMQTFAVLPGLKSRLRTPNGYLEFEMLLPDNIEIASVVALALLGERSNGTREILIGGGFMSFSQGLPKERNMQVTYDKAPDQSGAPEGYEIYRIKSVDNLKPGEYAFMVNKPASGAIGPLGGAQANYNFYEIGID